MEELFKQEIIELTEFLNNDEEWADLKNVLMHVGIDISSILLVSFMEDDEDNEYGVIVGKDLKVNKYTRKTSIGSNIDDFMLFDITNDINELNNYPQIAVAIKMIQNGEL